MGYDLAQINSRELDEFFNQYSKTKQPPEIIVVKKSFSKFRKRVKQKRFWKLKHLTKDEEPDFEPEEVNSKQKKGGRN